jgi:hypothetical protein
MSAWGSSADVDSGHCSISRTHAFQRRIASSLPDARSASARS